VPSLLSTAVVCYVLHFTIQDLKLEEEGEYRVIKLPKDLAYLIDSLIGKYGYRSRTEFFKDATRQLLSEYGARAD
jgi:hypothetical protein